MVYPFFMSILLNKIFKKTQSISLFKYSLLIELCVALLLVIISGDDDLSRGYIIMSLIYFWVTPIENIFLNINLNYAIIFFWTSVIFADLLLLLENHQNVILHKFVLIFRMTLLLYMFFIVLCLFVLLILSLFS